MIDGNGTQNLNQDSANVTVDGKVSEEGGLGGGVIAVIIIFVVLVIIAGLWVALNIVAKKCPTSKIGKKFNDWKAKRALNNEQKRLMAMDKLKTAAFVNQTNASDEALSSADNLNNNVIHHPSGMKIPLSDNMRIGGAGNKVYPATDVDDGVAS